MAGGRYGWFPGHMAKALRDMEQRLKHIDLVVEVRDARVPISSANPDLDRLARHKRRLVVLNKVDVADAAATKAACSLLQSEGHRVIPGVALRDGSADKVLDAALQWLQAERPLGDLHLLLVAGMPNTGKSSLINALKRAARREGLLDSEQAFQKTARAGPLPGVTRQMGGFRVSRSPPVFLLDTPGVMPPAIRDEAVAVRLALAGLLPAGPGGLDEGVLLRHLMQMLVSEPRNRQQLWAAADGHLPHAATAGDAGPRGPRGADDPGARRRRQRAVGLARLVYDVVSLEHLPQQQWHPGLEDELEEPYEADPGPATFPLRRPVWEGGPSLTIAAAPPTSNLLGHDRGSGGGGWNAGGHPGAHHRYPQGEHQHAHGAGDPHGPGSWRDAEQRAAELIRRLTRGSFLDVTRRVAAQQSVLQAFREGALGRYTLDDLGQLEGG